MPNRRASTVFLSRTERAAWMRRLSSWQTPASMSEKVDELVELLGFEVLVQARAGFFREAQAASHFAALRGAELVRLVYPDERPDFEIKYRGTVQPFEHVEAGDPKRRRGDEYKKFRATAPAAQPYPAEEWLTPDQAAEWMEHAAIQKSDGRYDARCGLLIFLNGGEFGLHQTTIELLMKAATEPASTMFSEVWVLWNERAYRTW